MIAHMVAVCKSKRIDGLNENNANMVDTTHWRQQYPQGISVLTTFSALRNELMPSKEFRLCPAFSGPRKAGPA